MYIVAIAWLYVVLMVSITQPSPLKGVVTFLGAGLLPLALFLWLVGSHQRRRNRAAAERAAGAQAAAGEGPAGTSHTAPDRSGASVDPDH